MLYHLGPNPTVDVIVTKRVQNELFILLIRRSRLSSAEPGKWALPGGFIDTKAPKGEVWQPGLESELEAAKRELKEETGLDLAHLEVAEFRFLGIYDAPERDPRNTNTSWIASHVFTVAVNEFEGKDVKGMDDADAAKWFSISEIKAMDKGTFAFDHFAIIQEHFLKA
jgi:8-oxo-dGTP diphosphatase